MSRPARAQPIRTGEVVPVPLVRLDALCDPQRARVELDRERVGRYLLRRIIDDAELDERPQASDPR